MGLSRTTTRQPRSPAPQMPKALDLKALDLTALNLTGAKNLSARFDQVIDAMNRLPRPALMLLTVALFGYAALDPDGFAARMQALAAVPEPLWWMQGAVVTFYFGAREAHYARQGKKTAPKATDAVAGQNSP